MAESQLIQIVLFTFALGFIAGLISLKLLSRLWQLLRQRTAHFRYFRTLK
ncbi:hypothetical protein PSI9734_00727 [Pseudidiomarina piscicola]|uniref:Uncharacterized protein n=1 Tax=Pseudidiomarina piscicola TaxID=2614830 RepID=A0A6S6WTS4_9GAMM|nr:hypothetical protein PSI9734_00727 [Pseudidiomarina piscicola]VZT39599.1 hypothetical protein PSI9734_00727 [Pseudomonas aeruginosa]